MNLKIKNCEECPFYKFEYFGSTGSNPYLHLCNLKRFVERELVGNKRARYFIEDTKDEKVLSTPKWCPLIENKIVIEYKN